MKGKPHATQGHSQKFKSQESSDLEDGELPGEHLNAYQRDAFETQPRKQRKLEHGDAAGTRSRQHPRGGEGRGLPSSKANADGGLTRGDAWRRDGAHEEAPTERREQRQKDHHQLNADQPDHKRGRKEQKRKAQQQRKHQEESSREHRQPHGEAQQSSLRPQQHHQHQHQHEYHQLEQQLQLPKRDQHRGDLPRHKRRQSPSPPRHPGPAGDHANGAGTLTHGASAAVRSAGAAEPGSAATAVAAKSATFLANKEALKARLQGLAAEGGGSAAAVPAAAAGTSAAPWSSGKDALKARLQSLMADQEPAGGDSVAGAGAGAGGHNRGRSGPSTGAARAGAGASTAALHAAAGDVGKYRNEVYKDARPGVEIKVGSLVGGAETSSGPHHHQHQHHSHQPNQPQHQPPIKLSDVQALVLYVLSNHDLVEAPRWVFVKNKPLISKAVLVLACGLSSATMREKKHLLPFLSSLGRAAIVATTPQAKPAHNTAELLTTRVTLRNVKRKRAPSNGSAGEEEGPSAGAGNSGAADASRNRAGSGSGSGSRAASGGGAAAGPMGHSSANGTQGGHRQRDEDAGGSAADGKAGGISGPGGAGGGRGGQTESAVNGSGGSGGGPSPPPPPPQQLPLPPGPFPPSHYVATLEQLRSHNYPLPQLEADAEDATGAGAGAGQGGAEDKGRLVCPPGFVATSPSGDSTASERMVALDCEMCITEAGFELTRITLVAGYGWAPGTAAGAAAAAALRRDRRGTPGRDGKGTLFRGGGSRVAEEDDDGCGEGDFGGAAEENSNGHGYGNSTAAGFSYGEVLLDELVVPDRPIKDYNTRYSGITAKMLEGCTTRLEDVRERFLSLVPAESLLVGHGLENDLTALRTCHGRVLDTALLFPHPKGPPFKSALKILARRFLRRTIQEGSHDSAVDARTALDLVMLKIKHGPAYGCAGSGPHSNSPKLADLLESHCATKCCLVDRHDVLSRYVTGVAAAIPVASDDDAVAAAGRHAASGTYGFLWTQLTEVATFLFRRARYKARLEEARAAAAALAAAEAEEAAKAATNAEAAAAAGAAAGQGKARPGSHGGTATPGASVSPSPAAMKAPGAAAAAACATGSPLSAPHEPWTAAAAAAAAAASSAAAAMSAISAAAVAAAAGSRTPGSILVPGLTHGTGSGSGPDYSDAALDELLESYDRRLKSLWEALPPRCMLVIATGAGDTAEYDRLYEQKCKRRAPDSGLPAWTVAEETALIKLGAREMLGLCFAAVKSDE